jgi:hypothetical protein
LGHPGSRVRVSQSNEMAIFSQAINDHQNNGKAMGKGKPFNEIKRNV